ncbi:MAG: GIY-YIG nuclease family protein [Draconibacterium sp.]|nr:GIY-YIG nuclease family protein [Draconibacterium sp.]
MRAYTYILYSKKLDRYYIGSTELKPEQRLELHLSKNYGYSKYTAKANDWTIYESSICDNIIIARKVELYIKRMKSRKFVESLKDNTGKWDWIIERL